VKKSRRYREIAGKTNRLDALPLEDAIVKVCDLATAKFDETVEAAIRLGVDPRHADQQVRGTVVLPHGTGKTPTVAVFAEGDVASAAEEAGADVVGGQDLAERIQGGWLEFDVAIASPDMMKVVGPLGRILGPRGLMPNPKSGTVTPDVAKAVEEAKAGKIEYRVDRGANVHAPVGKVSFGPEKLRENIMAFLDSIARARPASLKGRYVRHLALSSTMGPGVTVDAQTLADTLR
jgi:large subunit ribosomal protein L1